MPSFTLDPRILTLPMLLQTVARAAVRCRLGRKAVRANEGRAHTLSLSRFLAGFSLILTVWHGVAGAADEDRFLSSPACRFWSHSSHVRRAGPAAGTDSGKGGSRSFLFGAMCFSVARARDDSTLRIGSVVAGLFFCFSSAHRLAQLGAPRLPSTRRAVMETWLTNRALRAVRGRDLAEGMERQAARSDTR